MTESPDPEVDTESQDSEIPDSTPEGEAKEASPLLPKRNRTWWWQRPTLRSIERDYFERSIDRESARDTRENERTRLPAEEEVHLGALVLVEAFTPSTVANLYRALEDPEKFQKHTSIDPQEELLRNRRGKRGGWQNLGYVRRPGKFSLGGSIDEKLPKFVDAAWLQLHYLTPSLAVVVSTFTITPEHGDLSGLLRADYHSDNSQMQIKAFGFAGGLRTRIPWSRPRVYSPVGLRYPSAYSRKKAVNHLIDGYEQACHEWLARRYSGRFAKLPVSARPIVRTFFTKNEAPYSGDQQWFTAINLDESFDTWESYDPPGWYLTDRGSNEDGRASRFTIAARRSDLLESSRNSEDTIWVLTQKLYDEQAGLIARLGSLALLDIYGDRLSEIRDQSQVRSRPRRPVQEAKDLDSYLIGDGLDAATVAEDLASAAKDLQRFRWDTAEYREKHYSRLRRPEPTEPRDFLPSLSKLIQERASRLKIDTVAITGNFRASAELRQAITNARLQRVAAILAVLATIAAVIALFVN
ncbi:hypothetical protein ACWEF6_06270 [Amycolatopsis sp. NPDC004772]